MSIEEISLEGRGLDGINRQNRKQDRMSAKRFLIRPYNAAAGFRDCLCSLGRSSCGLIEPAFCRAPRPFVPGLAWRGRRRAGARLTMAETLF